MRVGIFGGTFDPPHWGHLVLAEFVRDAGKLDEIWLMPALQPPHKLDRIITPAHLRMKMVELLCGDDPFIRPSDADLTHERQPSYTIDLLDELSQRFPQNQFILIIGGDSLVEFTIWHKWEDILKKHEVLVLPRRNADFSLVHPKVAQKAKIINSPLIEISSTEIRRRVGEGITIKYMTTQAVEEFIIEQKLYR